MPQNRADKRQVLLVDDDPDVLLVLAASLSGAGMDVTTANSGDEALKVLVTNTNIDMLISDYAMVGMSGVELLSQAQLLRPGLNVLLISGYADANGLRDILTDDQVLRKPFRVAEIINRMKSLRKCLSGIKANRRSRLGTGG